ncbi:hypothetical protein Ahu01nite_000940 [Winogradskya humida]|uniref:Uncharacterized protein n=1 Tax=Winogradskya humida TaxID=113566 RepID=A0ABQ3ZEL7_9ACTN|nr:hypothetical protein Ahu01nite_000940 [Actinoplanes humidus]
MGEDAAGLGEEGFTRGGEAGAAGVAIQQAYAQMAFHDADLLRQGLLADVQLHRGAGETQLLGDGDEIG